MSEFDKIAKDYEKLMEKQHKIFGDIDYYAEYKVKLSKKLVNRDKIKILEYGAGIGRNIPFFKRYFPKSDIFIFDISKKSLKIAAEKFSFVKVIYEDELFSYRNFFDFIFVAGVYHHVPKHLRIKVSKNIKELLKNNGIVGIFEHNPFNPITQHLVKTCEIDKDAELLRMNEIIVMFSNLNLKLIKKGYSLFFPPRLKFLNFLEYILRFIPLGGQYYAFFIKE